MEVEVALYATLIGYHPEKGGNRPFRVEIKKGSVVSDLLAELGIGEGEAKQVFIRHKSRPFDFPLEDGDHVAVFPAIAGG